MPDTKDITVENDLESAFADPVEDTAAPDTATPDTTPVVNEPSVADLTARLASMEKASVDGRIESYDLRRQISELSAALKEKSLATGSTEKEANEDVAAMLAAFIEKGPNKTFESYLEKNLKKYLDPAVKPLQQEVERLRKEKQVDQFLNEHKDVTVEDEKTLIEIINTTPWIKSMQGSVTDKLNAAYSQFISRDPKAYLGRNAPAAPADASLANAKKGAATLGTKPGSVKVTEGDEFDKVLEKAKASKIPW